MKNLIYLLSVTVVFVLFSCNGETKQNKKTSDEKSEKQVVSKQDTEVEKSEVHTNSENNVSAKEAFSYLKKLKVNSYGDIFIKYNEKSTTVINKELNKLEKGDPLYIDSPMGETLLIETTIGSSDAYSVVYSPGPSADPTFIFYKKGASKPSFSIPALEVYIPGNGSIYSAGHTNNVFNTRKKFVVKNDKLVEIEQAYYYVGLKTKTLKPIQLYRTKSLTNKIASLPANYSIEVVANEKGSSFYLIKTDFGLLGWVKVESTYGDLTIEGLSYAGD